MAVYAARMKVEATFHGDRKVFSVSAFNEGIGIYLKRLPTLWVEGEVIELRRNDAWAFVFFTLRDPTSGACLSATIPRRRFDALELALADGEKVMVEGKAEIYAAKRRAQLPRHDDRASRDRRSPRRDRAPQARPRRRRPIRCGAKARASPLPAGDRRRHGCRRRCPRRCPDRNPVAVPGSAHRDHRDARAGNGRPGGNRSRACSASQRTLLSTS